MENGVMISDGIRIEDMVLGLRTEEQGVIGSDKILQAEGDELFEECKAFEKTENESLVNHDSVEGGGSNGLIGHQDDLKVKVVNKTDDVVDTELMDKQQNTFVARSPDLDIEEQAGIGSDKIDQADGDELFEECQAFGMAENGVIDHESLANNDSAERGGSNGLIGHQDYLKVKVVNETDDVVDTELMDKQQNTLVDRSADLDIEEQAGIGPDKIDQAEGGELFEECQAFEKAENGVIYHENLVNHDSPNGGESYGLIGHQDELKLKVVNETDDVVGSELMDKQQNTLVARTTDLDIDDNITKLITEMKEKELPSQPGIIQDDIEEKRSTDPSNKATNTEKIDIGLVHKLAKDSEGPGFRISVSDLSSDGSELSDDEKEANEKDVDLSQSVLHSKRVFASESCQGHKSVNQSVPPPPLPAGIGRASQLLGSVLHVVQKPRLNGTLLPLQNQLVKDSENGDGEEPDELHEKLQMIRVKFLRLAYRLGHSPHNVVVAQVLGELALVEKLQGIIGGRVDTYSYRLNSLDRASAMAKKLEAAGQEPLDFSCTIMVLGKSGVGKSATINSIFDEVKFNNNAFNSGTQKVQDVVGMVQGIKVRVIDTPGLLPHWSDLKMNEKILRSIKQYIKRTPPDIVLYVDRLDMQSREFDDVPLLKTVTEILGRSVWDNAIVVLTHASSSPPEGPNGYAVSYDMFVRKRYQFVQQAIHEAAEGMWHMNSVSLVENHSDCRKNQAGQRVLPNDLVWKPHLLLESFAPKILAEARALLEVKDNTPGWFGWFFAPRARSPSFPSLLNCLLQSRQPVKLPTEQFDDEVLDNDSSDSDDDSEYDELPSFKPLTNVQVKDLSKDLRKAYYEELDYKIQLFIRKQLKKEKKMRKMMKEMQTAMHDMPSDYQDGAEEDSCGVPMPDLALPVSFDSDNPAYRYRYLDSSSKWVVRPSPSPSPGTNGHGWDHDVDVGVEGTSLQRLFVVKDKIPVSFSGTISKDKMDTNLQMELSSTVKHSEGKATSLGVDMQFVEKVIACILRSDTMFINWKKNKAVAGLSATLYANTLTGGLKIEDKLILHKQAQLEMSAGAVFGRDGIAYGGALEAILRDRDHPFGRFLSTLGVSFMNWHGDVAMAYTCKCQIPIGRATNLIGRVNFSEDVSGKASISMKSSEHLQLALIGLIPLFRTMFTYYKQGRSGS